MAVWSIRFGLAAVLLIAAMGKARAPGASGSAMLGAVAAETGGIALAAGWALVLVEIGLAALLASGLGGRLALLAAVLVFGIFVIWLSFPIGVRPSGGCGCGLPSWLGGDGTGPARVRAALCMLAAVLAIGLSRTTLHWPVEAEPVARA